MHNKLSVDIKPLALSPLSCLINWKGMQKNRHCYPKRVGDVDPKGVFYLSLGAGGGGDCLGIPIISVMCCCSVPAKTGEPK